MKRHFLKTSWALFIVVATIGLVFAVACGSEEAPTTAPDPTSPPDSDNRDPEADFSWHPGVVPEGDNYQTTFHFMAMASDPDGDDLSYEWTFAGGRPRPLPARMCRPTSPASPTTMSP